jgi:predicted Holliday junction resolvase-like endonuclease
MMWIVVVLVVVVVVAALVLVMRGRRTRRLQGSFGREYDRTVAKAGDQGDAESELVKRQDRRERLTIVPLTAEAHARYARMWHAIQTNFVDAPQDAVEGADQLVSHSAAPSDPRTDTLDVGGR